MVTMSLVEETVNVSSQPTFILRNLVTNNLNKNNNTIAIIIPGNPGIAWYYGAFMDRLNERNGDFPIYCVSHAGHVEVKSKERNQENAELLTLRGQIKHKLDFIKDYIPADAKLILMGHSIGAYMILHMLPHLGDRVVKCMMLFPTVERLADTPSGYHTTPLLKYLRWVAPYPLYLLKLLLPESMKIGILSWFFKGRTIPDSAVHASLNLFDPNCVRNITNLAHEEMQKVIEADYSIIEDYEDKIWWYYGATDHWCPVSYYEAMKAKFPNGEIFLCKNKYEHAFVLENSTGMADIVYGTLVSKGIISEHIPDQ